MTCVFTIITSSCCYEQNKWLKEVITENVAENTIITMCVELHTTGTNWARQCNETTLNSGWYNVLHFEYFGILKFWGKMQRKLHYSVRAARCSIFFSSSFWIHFTHYKISRNIVIAQHNINGVMHAYMILCTLKAKRTKFSRCTVK